MNAAFYRYGIVVLKAGILLSIAGFASLVAASSLITTNEYISTAVTIDLAITLPLLYFFFIRGTSVPRLTVIPVFLFSVVIASLVLPRNDRYLLNILITYAVPVIEVLAFIYIGSIIYRSRKTFAAMAKSGNDVMERLRKVLQKELKMEMPARAAAFELAVIYIAFFKWRQKCENECFTYHKRSGALPMLAVLIGLIVVETIVIHYIAGLWNTTAAWILTAISAYFLLQVFAHAKAVVLRPVEIRDNTVFVRCGLIGDAEIKIDNVEGIEILGQTDIADDSALAITPLGGMSIPNIKCRLRQPANFNSFYGIRKPFSTIMFAVDEPERFMRHVERPNASAVD